ncbi:MAG: alanyl-tRNA editing protein [Candidatus Gastranaerophilales bacterium]|nr:alanyl-tRNA editing protein [Candidatus Gastranaerophilales bacterium]
MTYLYYEDIYMTDFDATVTACVKDERSGHFQVVLDRTAFFPEQGGQSADKGTLGGREVLDVQIRDNIIYHVLAEAVPVGQTLSGHVDWEQRFDFMQQHTGEHMISGLVHKYYHYENVGFHLSVNEVTLDFNGELTLEQLRRIEEEANAAVWKGLPVKACFPSREELAALSYRSKKELSGDIRIVEIPGIDICACCAPHVANTAQIGLIKIVNVQSHRGGVRVHILCGGRAVRDYTTKQDSVSLISAQLSAKQDDVADAVSRLQNELQRQKARICELQRQLLQFQTKALPSPEQAENVILFVEELDPIAMRNAINELTPRYRGYCGIFSGSDQSGYRFIIGSAGKDCNALAVKMREELSAKGGGSSPMIQGNVNRTEEELRSYFSRLTASF